MNLRAIGRGLVALAIVSGLVSVADLNRMVDQALLNGWQPVSESCLNWWVDKR